jgi:transposase
MIYTSINERDSNKRWTHSIDGKILVVNDPPYRQIFIGSVLIADYLIGSKFEEATALVILAKNESISVPNLASAFGIHHKTLYSYISSYKANGLEGLRPAAHYPGKVNNELIDFIRNEQHSNPKLTLTMLNRKLYQAYELTLSEKTIRKLVESETIEPLCKEPDGQVTLDEFLSEAPIKEEEPDSIDEKDGDFSRYAGYSIFSPMITELFSRVYK